MTDPQEPEGSSASDDAAADDAAEVERRRRRATRRLLRGFRSADSYGLVLLMIIVTYIVAVNVDRRGATWMILLQILTVRLSLHTSLARPRVRRIADFLFAVAAASALANLFMPDPKDLEFYVFVLATLLYFVAPVAIVRHVAFRPEVDQETMLGALSAYLFLGMAFAFTYHMIGLKQHDPSFFGANGPGTLSQDLFFSFTTLTTTGYGNLVPAANPGQTFAVCEMLIGQLFLVTAVGKIVTAWRPKGWASPTGA